jgi:hypothetical protein
MDYKAPEIEVLGSLTDLTQGRNEPGTNCGPDGKLQTT